MPILYSFCTWFSVRTGCVIVALVSLVEGILSLGPWLIAICVPHKISFVVEAMLKENDFLFAERYLAYLQKNIVTVSLCFIFFHTFYICCCLLLFHGAYKLSQWEILPFVIIEFFRLLTYPVCYVATLMIIHKNVLDFNIVIVWLMCGGFALLMLYYFWLCPVSLLQCIYKVNRSNVKSNTKGIIYNHQFSNYNYYLSDFQFKPVMPNRNYYQYQYGNVPALYF